MVWRTIILLAFGAFFVASATTSFLCAGKVIPPTRQSVTAAINVGYQKPDLERASSAGVSCDSRLLGRISSVPCAIFDSAPLIYGR